MRRVRYFSHREKNLCNVRYVTCITRVYPPDRKIRSEPLSTISFRKSKFFSEMRKRFKSEGRRKKACLRVRSLMYNTFCIKAARK